MKIDPHKEQQILLAQLPGMAYRAQADGGRTLLAASAGSLALIGVPAEELAANPARQRTLEEFIHPADVSRVRLGVANGIASGEPFELAFRLKLPDGAVRFVHDRADVVRDDEGRVMEIVGFLSDTTARVEEKQWLRRVHHAIVAVAKDRSLSDGDVTALARLVSRTAAEVLEVSRSGVWLLSEDRTELRLISLYVRDTGEYSDGALIHASDFPRYFAALSSGRAIDADDAASDPRTSEFAPSYLRQNDVHSMLDSTIRLGGEVIGVLCNEQVGKPRRWELQEISFAGELADQMAQAIANQRRREAERSALEAAHSSAAKSRFLATMSHEIRTPMNGVLGMVQLLEETPLSPEQKQYVQAIHESGDLLLHIVNDVLDFARIEAEKLEVVDNPLRLSRVVRGSVTAFMAVARREGVEIQARVDAGLPDTIMGDEGRIRQILTNLLGNAFKFTSEGSVTLDVFGREESGERRICFRVTDTGEGIDPCHLESMFEPFRQNPLPGREPQAGSGLGLAISRRLAALMGGSLTACSQPGKGSEFTLELPLREAPTLKDPTTFGYFVDDRGPLPNFSRLRVLVAEDNRINRKVVCSMLKGYGIEPVTCANGRELLDILDAESEAFDVILMDCQMPVMTGYEATRRVRERTDVHRRTPIVALTAHALPEFRQLAVDAGMNDYLAKPITRHSLELALDRVDRRRRLARRRSS